MYSISIINIPNINILLNICNVREQVCFHHLMLNKALSFNHHLIFRFPVASLELESSSLKFSLSLM